jgi:hypothetical protein
MAWVEGKGKEAAAFLKKSGAKNFLYQRLKKVTRGGIPSARGDVIRLF